MKVKRGDVIYLKKAFPEDNHIRGGKRPYVVVSNDVGNFHSNICMVVPLTSKVKKIHLPTHTFVSYRRNMCLCEQVFTVSQEDVDEVKTNLPRWDMKNINRCLKIALACVG